MPTRTKKTAPPKPDIVTTAGFEPVRITTKTTKTVDAGVPLFYLDDVEYRVPGKVSRSVVLEFLRLSRTDGELIAAQRVLERLLGPTAYQALEQSDEVDDDTLEKIMRAVIHHISGTGESGK